jgi:tartrate dehydratase beta subunit/fumarate hydratase class I family protein
VQLKSELQRQLQNTPFSHNGLLMMEAIAHAKVVNVPIVIVINKVGNSYMT